MGDPVVLIAINQPSLAGCAAETLEAGGFRVIRDSASQPPEAPEAAAARLADLCRRAKEPEQTGEPEEGCIPGLLLLDIHWGGPSQGPETARLLRERAAWSNPRREELEAGEVPILFAVPPEAGEELRTAALEVPRDGWISTDSSPGLLEQTVRRTMELAEKRLQLRERMKEIRCLEQLGELANRPAISPEEILTELPAITAEGFLYPQDTAVRIELAERNYQNTPYPEDQPEISHPIQIFSSPAGRIRIAYLSPHPRRDEGPFLTEEVRLLRTLAIRLGHTLERLESAREAREEKEQLQMIVEGEDVGTWKWDYPTGKLEINEKWAGIIGYTREELEPVSIQTWEHFCHPGDLQHSQEQLEKLFRGEISYYEAELRMLHRENRWVWIRDRGVVISRDSAGTPLIIRGTHRDITERRLAEDRYRSLYEDAPVGIFRSTSSGRLEHLNPAMARLIGRATPREILREQPDIPRDFYPDPSQREDFVRRLQEDGLVRNKLLTLRDTAGELHQVSITARKGPEGPDGSFYIDGFITDITEIQRSQERIQNLLESKKMLLKEIHHRVKNNFSTVISLLNLQSSRAKNREAQQAILEASNRIRSIAGIYTQLYQQDSYQEINIKDFLEGIISPIIQSYQENTDTRLHLDIPSLAIPVSHGARWGIIINELITNSFKYAQPAVPPLAISIALSQEEDRSLLLVYRDNGGGIPRETLENREFGLGLGMIENLVTSSGGTLSFEDEPGAAVIHIRTEPLP